MIKIELRLRANKSFCSVSDRAADVRGGRHQRGGKQLAGGQLRAPRRVPGDQAGRDHWRG